ncbi:hypothetical protein LCGC14_1144400 [marine sediment metagenome]|uniref:Uncharacterized protein n=1 Tax=marine sediment metagenome TaxID=412755 RepID=A0A0F9PFJ7_9ZZZZ
MATRKEIREGILREVCCICVHKPTHYRKSYSDDKNIQVYGLGCSFDYEEDGGQYCLLVQKVVTAILRELDSHGVVIKVERELPELDIATNAEPYSCNELCHKVEQLNMFTAGYVAVESLID